MKKKALSILCAALLVSSMSVTAFAAEGNTTYDDLAENKESEHIVTVEAEVEELGDVYSVLVEWTNLAFTYTEETPASWDDEQHKVVASEGTWSSNGEGSVSVTNNSNVDVYGKITYAQDAGYQSNLADKGVTVTATPVDTSTQLKAGNEDNVTAQTTGENQNKIVATVNVTGAPTESLSNVTAGTFTATVSTSAIEG